MFAVIHFPDVNQNPEIDTAYLCRIANRFSPLFEIVDLRTVAINVNGLNLLFPGGIDEIRNALEEELKDKGASTIVIGENLSQAVLAAFCRGGTTLIESSRDLEDIPLAALDLPARYAETFSEWGLKTVKDIVSLPVNDLISRLGRDIEPIIRNLTAGLLRPLNPQSERREFTRLINLDDPLEDTERCLIIIEEKLRDILAEMQHVGLAAAGVALTVSGRADENYELDLKLPLPSVNLRFMVKLLQLEMEKIQTEFPVRKISLKLTPEPPRSIQQSFWQPPMPDAEKLELTLAKLKKLLGEDNVGVPVMLDSFNQQAFEICDESRLASIENENAENSSGYVVFRYFLEALPVKFNKSFDEPYYLEIGDYRRRIKRIAGPWITSGDWWSDKSQWSRREIDVQLADGQIYRIIERKTGEYFAEGYYD